MSMDALPKKLEKEPLLDAICELTVSSQFPLLAFLPGHLHATLGKEVTSVVTDNTIPGAPPGAIAIGPGPQQVRLNWKGHTIVVAERSISLIANMPYVGWETYSEGIKELIQKIVESKLVHTVDRVAIRYVNLFPEDRQFGAPMDALNWSLKVGSLQIERGNTQLRHEYTEHGITTVISVVSNAQVMVVGRPTTAGLILDISAVFNTGCPNIEAFAEKSTEMIANLKLASKRAFFDCLSAETLKLLGPAYA